jgi:succinyl-diaminopimelate desuccinylase
MPLSDARQEIKSVISEMRDDIIQFAQGMMKIPSISGDEKRCSEFIASELRSIGLETFLVGKESGRPNVVSLLKGASDGKTLGFHTHDDVVPEGRRDLWKFDPWGGEIQEGKMYARGASDCKAGIVAGVMGVKALTKAGIKLQGNVRVTVPVGEEIGWEAGTQFLFENGYLKADDIILGCPTLRGPRSITTSHKSFLQLEATTYGKAVPTAFPWTGVNAVEKMCDFIVTLKNLKLDFIPHKLHPQGPTMSLGTMIKGGFSPTATPETCTATLDFRLLPAQKKQDLMDGIMAIVNDMKSKDPSFRIEFTETRWVQGDDVPENFAIVSAVQKASVDVLGEVANIEGIPPIGPSSYLNNIAKIPSITWSPGDSKANIHGPDEWVRVEDMITISEGYALASIYYLGLAS